MVAEGDEAGRYGGGKGGGEGRGWDRGGGRVFEHSRGHFFRLPFSVLSSFFSVGVIILFSRLFYADFFSFVFLFLVLFLLIPSDTRPLEGVGQCGFKHGAMCSIIR